MKVIQTYITLIAPLPLGLASDIISLPVTGLFCRTSLPTPTLLYNPCLNLLRSLSRFDVQATLKGSLREYLNFEFIIGGILIVR